MMAPSVRLVSAILSTLESNISRSIASLLCSFSSCALRSVMSRATVTTRCSPPSSTTTDDISTGISLPLLVAIVTSKFRTWPVVFSDSMYPAAYLLSETCPMISWREYSLSRMNSSLTSIKCPSRSVIESGSRIESKILRRLASLSMSLCSAATRSLTFRVIVRQLSFASSSSSTPEIRHGMRCPSLMRKLARMFRTSPLRDRPAAKLSASSRLGHTPISQGVLPNTSSRLKPVARENSALTSV
jgi:hypothetical protein